MTYRFSSDKLKESPYGADASIDQITARFDETTKKLFRDKKDTSFIQFGSILEKDAEHDIKSGKLKLAG